MNAISDHRHQLVFSPESSSTIRLPLRLRRAAPAVVVGLIILLAASALGPWSCAGGRALLPTPEELLASGAARAPEREALRRGRAIYVTECGACHRLYAPEEFASGKWPGLVRRMGQRASLGDGEIADLALYLVSATRAEKSGKR